MFDIVSTELYSEPFALAHRLFLDHGHELAEAASMLGGSFAEAKVVSCALQLQAEGRITPRLRREMTSLHHLLALDRVSDPESLESFFFAKIDPGCSKVELICLLTDMLADVLETIDLWSQPHEGGAQDSFAPA